MRKILKSFLQSRKQRDWFDKFPELIILDGTYKINNAGMALYDILVEDGFGSSYVAYCFVAQEIMCPWSIFFSSLKSTIQGERM